MKQTNLVSKNIASTMMLCGMFGSCHDFKIFDSIVKFVSIDVVDYFIRTKRTVNLFFHDKAMHFNCFAIKANYFVTMLNVYSIGWSVNSFKASIHSQPLVMFFTKAFAKSWLATAFNFTWNVFNSIRAANQMRSAVFAFHYVVIPAKTFCKLGLVTAFNFASKIFNAIGASGFCFHGNNLTLFGDSAKQNTRG